MIEEVGKEDRIGEVEGNQAMKVDVHTASVFRKNADKIMPKSIKMVEDAPGNHSSGRMPILDMEIAIVDGFIEHYHNAKPMASKAVILASSAFTLKEKMNILVNEGNRRCKNCSTLTHS